MSDNASMPETHTQRGVNLTTDLSSDDAIPYFLWDQPITVAELRRRLSGPPEERYRYLGAILREAREPDVWRSPHPPRSCASGTASSRSSAAVANSGGFSSRSGASSGWSSE
jgi:hypothetical protein